MSLKYFAPNLLTTCNLSLGGFSLWLCLKGQFTQAWAWVLVCTALDGLDGRVARRLSAASAFGRFFDSCADLISFGCVPAFAFWLKHAAAVWGGGMAASGYLLCAILRLIRFHRLCGLNESTPRRYFIGLPTTASGGLYASTALLWDPMPARAELGLLLVLAALMISELRVPSVDGLVGLKGAVGARPSTPFPR